MLVLNGETRRRSAGFPNLLSSPKFCWGETTRISRRLNVLMDRRTAASLPSSVTGGWFKLWPENRKSKPLHHRPASLSFSQHGLPRTSLWIWCFWRLFMEFTEFVVLIKQTHSRIYFLISQKMKTLIIDGTELKPDLFITTTNFFELIHCSGQIWHVFILGYRKVWITFC